MHGISWGYRTRQTKNNPIQGYLIVYDASTGFLSNNTQNMRTEYLDLAKISTDKKDLAKIRIEGNIATSTDRMRATRIEQKIEDTLPDIAKFINAVDKSKFSETNMISLLEVSKK
jgi:hypothetical protein